ncbi:Protein yjbJ [Candidatus Phaeomarinobacter ectocarpi]|uniref:Protein yjbJ n=1 Tax=Candidatus Phaeomarinibacter ectocarpi TaxID=1458461 RepID=X5MD98_9HYPH|nr:CsbD family protein [Candidatus Phaeomarinobacter ectocarpi]CDO60012.1 Protein yjbJ [Candidatus Phaeomarinobacter ectocarpi]
MSNTVLKGKWHELKGSAKTKWGKLTDDEVDQVDGNAERLIGLVQQKYGKARDAAEKEVNDWIAS